MLMLSDRPAKPAKSQKDKKRSNPVAKHAPKFNRAATHRDRAKYYPPDDRKRKPHGREFRYRGVLVAGTGFELPRENPVKTGIPNHGGAECGAHSAQHLERDPHLQTLILAWPDLPATLKAGILAMVESCTDP